MCSVFTTLCNLTKVELIKCMRLNIPAINSTSLETLNLGWTDITAPTVLCPNLKTLDMSGCSKISDINFVNAFSSCQNLLYMWLIRTGINDNTLASICAVTKQLQIINITQSANITTNGVLAILSCCKHIKRIYCKFCTVSPEVISQLEASCKIPKGVYRFDSNT